MILSASTVILPLNGRVHPAEEAAHLTNRADGNELYSVGVAQYLELLACREVQRLTNGPRNDDLKFG